MRGLRVQLGLPTPETVGILSPESCDAVNERRLRGMGFLPMLEEDGTFRTPIETIDDAMELNCIQ